MFNQLANAKQSPNAKQCNFYNFYISLTIAKAEFLGCRKTFLECVRSRVGVLGHIIASLIVSSHALQHEGS